MRRSTFRKIFCITSLIIIAAAIIPAYSSDSGNGGMISGVGIAILAATVMAFIGHLIRQPLILAYIAAGIIIGPEIGFGFVSNMSDIETISHFGLILLLFLIGLEIDIKKLRDSGRSLIAGGLTQFPISIILGIGFFMLMGYTLSGAPNASGGYDALYLAACCGLSSTAIAVKLLYGKFELDTLAGRLTLGILVFQDIWAIILLGIQPNLANPDILQILLSFSKGLLLVAASLAMSRFVLPRLFRSIAKTPELVLISSLGWCFLVCGGAAFLDLSLEMGALIAGVAISTFPYNLDVIAKVVNIRDFFVTLFFVSLGMKIPDPSGNPHILLSAAAVSVFIIGSRFLSVFPVLYGLRNGIRVSLLTSINLAQLSEFSLVIASLGAAAGHIRGETLSIIIFAFVMTSVATTYGIKYNDRLQKMIGTILKKFGFRETASLADVDSEPSKREIAILGFHRTASSLIHEALHGANASGEPDEIKEKLVVIDFNPEVHESLQSMGIDVVYGDIGHLDTLHHAGIHDVKIVISTIPDTILVGTDNLRIIRHIRELCPRAKIIVTAESIDRALKMYAEGADHVFVPRILSALNILDTARIFIRGNEDEIAALREREIESLSDRIEIIR